MMPDISTPLVMGILNVTPDSFSDGGKHLSLTDACVQAERMATAGAGLIDVGGESTRPGSDPVPLQQELDRVIPVIELIRARTDLPVSIDTSKSKVMSAAIAAGATLINDVTALRGEGSLEAVARCNVPVCLMHMLGEPRTMQTNPGYEDVVATVTEFFSARIEACTRAGIDPDNIILDPGFGFGKRLLDNLQLLRQLRDFTALGKPILVGFSRKSMLGEIAGVPIEKRLVASIAMAMIAVMNGANIVRVHDVAETVQAMAVFKAVQATAI